MPSKMDSYNRKFSYPRISNNDDDFETPNDFERGRIKALQEERLHIQKKTFTKWINSFLVKVRLEIEDLFTDLADGKNLLKLLEIISGEKLGKPNAGKMRVHKIENVNRSLAFLHTKVRLESIGAEDIVDGNPRLILGLVWTIILRFQIQMIEVEDQEENGEKKSAKDALLLWCQRRTQGYPNVEIKDFTSSWRNGLGFNALIHSQRPDLVSFNKLNSSDHIGNLQSAFDIAEKHFDIPQLLDAEDVDIVKPDEKSVLTYVSSFYHTFSRLKTGHRGGKRIENIVSKIQELDNSKVHFEYLSSSLLEWIAVKIIEMKDRHFENSLEGIQSNLKQFKNYLLIEKPIKCKEKVDIEVTYFEIQTKLKQLNQSPYVFQRLSETEQAWSTLEKEEHCKEVAIKKELIRQEKLTQLASRFFKKTQVREGYLEEMISVLSDDRYGSNIQHVEASLKKHEAISADILSREDRFSDLNANAEELILQNYVHKDEIQKRCESVFEKWRHLTQLLIVIQEKLVKNNNMTTLLREIATLSSSIKKLKGSFISMEIEHQHHQQTQVQQTDIIFPELLQKLHLLDSELSGIADSLEKMKGKTRNYLKPVLEDDTELSQSLERSMSELLHDFECLVKDSRVKRKEFEDLLVLYQMNNDLEEIHQWLNDKIALYSKDLAAKDLRALEYSKEKDKTFSNEMERWHQKYSTYVSMSKELSRKTKVVFDLSKKTEVLEKHWETLKKLLENREKRSLTLSNVLTFLSDCNDVDSWLKEMLSLVSSSDYGTDEFTSRALRSRHKEIEEVVKAFESETSRILSTGQTLINSSDSLLLTSTQSSGVGSQETPSTTVVIEERILPQVRARYPYAGHGVDVLKDEILFLLNKSNSDWWNIRQFNGNDGFVPKNYVVEVEPKVVQVEVVKSFNEVSLSPQVSAENLKERVRFVVEEYAKVLNQTHKRGENLNKAIELFHFTSLCDDGVCWMKEKMKNIYKEESESSSGLLETLGSISRFEERVNYISNQAETLLKTLPSEKTYIKRKNSEVTKMWEDLRKTKEARQKSLEGNMRLESFYKTIEETLEWINEKNLFLKGLQNTVDIEAKELDHLSRRHKAFERELGPISEKVKHILGSKAVEVKKCFPEEKVVISQKLNDLTIHFEDLYQRAAERSILLSNRLMSQKFENEEANYLLWASKLLSRINDETPNKSDYNTDSKSSVEIHNELYEEIMSKEDVYEETIQEGKSLGRNTENLKVAHSQLKENWKNKNEYLKKTASLYSLYKEADILDAFISSQLRQYNAGSSYIINEIEELESAMKRENELVNSLEAHNSRYCAFKAKTDEDSNEDEELLKKKRKLEAKWSDLLVCRESAKNNLKNTKEFLDFQSSVDNMNKFIEEKFKVARDISFRDSNHLKIKMKQHDLFEGELKANASQVKLINMVGHNLMEMSHPRSSEIQSAFKNLNENWDRLLDETQLKNKRLKQANDSSYYGRFVSDIDEKLESVVKELEESLRDPIIDRRHVQRLLSHHQSIAANVKVIEGKISCLEEQAESLVEGHFEADKISRSVKECQRKMRALRPLLDKRLTNLIECNKYQELKFELDSELRWIREKMTVVSTKNCGKSLQQVRALAKRHKNLEEEIASHYPVIEKLNEIAERDFKGNDEIDERVFRIQGEWNELKELMSLRSFDLEINQRYQSYFFEVNEIENWIELKNSLMKSTDYGKDEDSTLKLLTKHKSIELEIDSYTGIIHELKNEAQKLSGIEDSQGKMVKNKDEVLSSEIKSLHRHSQTRRRHLLQRLLYHEFMRESHEFSIWITEKTSSANSLDVGQDYEHLEVLTTKFDNFKRSVLIGNDKFSNCVNLAKRILADGGDDEEIFKIQNDLTNSWENLSVAILRRDKRLLEAGEIHRYHRDVSEYLLRIGEKLSSLGDDYGKDVKSVKGNLRSHQVFENDLVALEVGLQVLLDDAAALEKKYSDPKINSQKNNVLSIWKTLQERARERKTILENNYKYHQFLISAKDYLNWASHTKELLRLSEDKVTDIGGAKALKMEHENLRAQMKSREETFASIVQNGKEMTTKQQQSSSSSIFEKEIESKLEALTSERQGLTVLWQQKKVYLDQLTDYCYFSRDARQILALYNKAETALLKDSSSLSNSVEETDKEIKGHETLCHLLSAYEEKTVALKAHSNQLIEQAHFDSSGIASKMMEVETKKKIVLELSYKKACILSSNKLYQEFNRDSFEMETWMSEKRRKFTEDSKNYESGTLNEKIKFLKRYQVFEKEITQNASVLNALLDKGKALLQGPYRNEASIEEKLSQLQEIWSQLNQLSENIHKDYKDALDRHNFSMQAERIEAWIRDKELMITASELGKDFEHCRELERKLNDADSDMKVDDEKMTNMKSLASSISSSDITERCSSLLSKWTLCQKSLFKYRETLNAALVIHKFHSDIDETYEMIAEKCNQLLNEDRGGGDTSLEETKKNTKKVNNILDFLKSLKPKIQEYTSRNEALKDSSSLSKNASEKLNRLKGLMDQNIELCETLLVKNQNRIKYCNFILSLRKQSAHFEELKEQIEMKGVIPVSQEEIDAASLLHGEKKSLFLAPAESLLSLKAELKGFETLVSESELSFLSSSLSDLEREFKDTKDSWDKTNRILSQCNQYRIFNSKMSEYNSWIEKEEAFLENRDLGDSLADVEILLRKHDSFDKALIQASGQGFSTLESESRILLDANHFAKNEIEDNLCKIQFRLDTLKENSSERAFSLEHSRRCHLLLRKIHEMKSWTKEKLRIALDDTYLDLTNILSKIQRHSAFESEVTANSGRLESLQNEAEPLVNLKTAVSKDVTVQLNDLISEWTHLNETIKNKKIRLEQANDANSFYSSLKELEQFEEDVKEFLRVQDLGKDSKSVKNLLFKIEAILRELEFHEDNIGKMKEKICKLSLSGGPLQHFMLPEMKKQTDYIALRFDGLSEPLLRRKEMLEESQAFIELQRDALEEIFWLEEKSLLVSCKDYGSSLVTVESLLKKHQYLETDIHNHETSIGFVSEKGQEMIRCKHSSSQQIKVCVEDLVKRLSLLKESYRLRKRCLENSLASQHFYIQCTELLLWIQEKNLFLTSKEYIDEESIQSIYKRFDALESELERHIFAVKGLTDKGNDMISKAHFDSQGIADRVLEVQTAFQKLTQSVKVQRRLLANKSTVLSFLQKSEELLNWMNTQVLIAGSEEYGKDLFHVEVLIQKFDLFLKSLEAQRTQIEELNVVFERYTNSTASPDEEEERFLTQEKKEKDEEETDKEKLRVSLLKVSSQWEDLNELALARQEALFGAKQVHSFDKKVDETIEWISEKEAILSVDETCQDIETAHALLQRQEGLRRDLIAIETSVKDILEKEAKELCVSYPDAAEHISVKSKELSSAMRALASKATERDQQLKQNEKLLAYLGDYRELMSWITEIMAKVTGPELVKNLQDAEFLRLKHDQYFSEIESRNVDFVNFESTGKSLLSNKYLVMDDIQERISTLLSRKKTLDKCWSLRSRIYTQHLDYLTWIKEIEELDNWLSKKEMDVSENSFGTSIENVEELLTKHIKIEKSLFNKDESMSKINRLTLIESEFAALREKEEAARLEDENRREVERIMNIKKKEIARISRERKREDERRRTQEIVFNFNSNVLKDNSVCRPTEENKEEYNGGNISLDSSKNRSANPPLPSFNTRRSFRTSLRKKDSFLSNVTSAELPPVIHEGYLERKQQLQTGGRKAAIRSWKNFYTLHCGQLLSFFRDKEDFKDGRGAVSPPLCLSGSSITIAKDYTKKKYVIRICLSDASEYLFDTGSEDNQKIWMTSLSEQLGEESFKNNVSEPSSKSSTMDRNEESFDDESAESLGSKKSRFGRFLNRKGKAV